MTHAVPTVVRVSRTVKIDGADEATDSESEEILEIHKFATQPAIVRFSYPVKRSVQFQSAGLEIGVDLPCYAEEVDEGITRAKEIVVSHMKRHLPELDKVVEHLVEMKRQAESRF